MGLHDTVQLRGDLPNSFEDDGCQMTEEMVERYATSNHQILDGQMRSHYTYFCKNASIFDLTGRKIAWGDITPEDVSGLRGIHYILSEHKSYWEIDKEAVKERTRNPLSGNDATLVDLLYIKRNAIARINDGQIETSSELIFLHYQ